MPRFRRDPLDRELRARGPWVTRLRIGDRAYGGRRDLADDERVGRFFGAFPACRSVPEVGSLEGAHSRRVERVVAVAGWSGNVERARSVRGLLGTDEERDPEHPDGPIVALAALSPSSEGRP